MRPFLFSATFLCAALFSVFVPAGETDLPDRQSPPAVQVFPLPRGEASFTHMGQELTRYYFDAGLKRPFLYPLIGPGGVSYTRMGHPHDPVTHSHHNSVWISHENVAGVSFWADTSAARIVCQRIEQYEDGPEEAWLLGVNAWQDGDGKTLMSERRRIAMRPLEAGQWQLTIDLELSAPAAEAVTLGQTPFGIVGVRMAKSIGVNDGGGRILNSEGALGEEAIFRKPARWVDCSGPVSVDADGGITLMDQPQNVNHPAPFHVRADGWMGACLTFGGPLVIEPQKPLRLRYGLWVHQGVPDRAAIDPQWQRFAAAELPSLAPARR